MSLTAPATLSTDVWQDSTSICTTLTRFKCQINFETLRCPQTIPKIGHVSFLQNRGLYLVPTPSAQSADFVTVWIRSTHVFTCSSRINLDRNLAFYKSHRYTHVRWHCWRRRRTASDRQNVVADCRRRTSLERSELASPKNDSQGCQRTPNRLLCCTQHADNKQP